MELHLHSPIRLRGVVLNYAERQLHIYPQCETRKYGVWEHIHVVHKVTTVF
jgi:hypothetical protein